MGIAFAQACQEDGQIGFALRLLDSGDLRLIGLSLPRKTVADMLRTAADAYEANVEPETLN
ncbi:hypothetical protein [Luteimonas saliphila]|uniref:hypothetical protein n=1 Tax=Luteimonas saliphila TaxID=2804919 RepID=UPI00192E1BA5|nr:hypothetical protein [Luteimonas saliphila]